MVDNTDAKRYVENIDSDEAKRISITLFKLLGNALGVPVAKGMLKLKGLGPELDDPNKELEHMIENLINGVGSQTLNNMLYVTVTSEFGEEGSRVILEKMGIPLLNYLGGKNERTSQ